MSNNNGDFLADLRAHTAQLEQELKEQSIVEPAPPYAATGATSQLSDELLQSIIELRAIDVKRDIERPPYCLYIDESPIFGLGDISTIIGKAKSRKTFASTILTAAMVGNTTIGGRLRGELPDDKRGVLFIDTEQSEYYAQLCARRVYGLLDKDYYNDELPNFQSYSLRPHTPMERLLIIEKLIYETPNLGFVVIDGIRDLITSINDEEQATLITSRLLKWSTERMIHICCILHMNKNDANARGHVGTELMNKSLAVLAVNKLDKNEDYSEIVPVTTREKEPPSIVFGIDDGLPFLLSDTEAAALTAPSDRKKTVNVTDWDNEQHTEILQRIFERESKMNYGDFVGMVQNRYDVGLNKAKNFIAYFKSEGLIKCEKEGKTTIYSMV